MDIFPNTAAVIRLVGALMLEQNDEWIDVAPLHGAGNNDDTLSSLPALAA